MKIKHSKYKNTGILFELLVRQITADTLKGVDSPAIDILKKFFVKRDFFFLKINALPNSLFFLKILLFHRKF